MIKAIQNFGWLCGALVAVAGALSYGTWFWASKHSWISESWMTHGTYTHCLDLKFRPVKIGGSIVTTFAPHERETTGWMNEGRNAELIRVAATLDADSLLFGNMKVTQIDQLRSSKHMSVFEGMPILHHIPDMDFGETADKPVGTVSFTLSLDSLTALPTKISADFKSTLDVSIESKTFFRVGIRHPDQRCVVR